MAGVSFFGTNVYIFASYLQLVQFQIAFLTSIGSLSVLSLVTIINGEFLRHRRIKEILLLETGNLALISSYAGNEFLCNLSAMVFDKEQS